MRKKHGLVAWKIRLKLSFIHTKKDLSINSGLFKLVEVSGFEPLTSCMPCKRSPN